MVGWRFYLKTGGGSCAPLMTLLPPFPVPPSGEVGFRAMSESLGWAKRPMLDRIHLLPPSMPITMLYGSRSWVDSSSGNRVVQIRNRALTKVLVSHEEGVVQSGSGWILSV